MKHILIACTTIALITLYGCSGSDTLDESFNIINNTNYELTLRYKLNGSELDASDISNYNEAGEFNADITFIEQVPPGQSLTFYTITMAQHATWHATGPAEPEEMFENISVEAVDNGTAVSLPFIPTFIRYQQELTPGTANISGSNYEYTATINEDSLRFIINE